MQVNKLRDKKLNEARLKKISMRRAIIIKYNLRCWEELKDFFLPPDSYFTTGDILQSSGLWKGKVGEKTEKKRY